jgi:hypothetical protein
MYPRLYGTSHCPSTHRLVRIKHRVWLQVQSPAARITGILCGTGGLILVTILLFSFGRMGLVSETIGAIMLLATGLAILLSLCALAGVVLWWSWNAQPQYCPDCLSYMTRGATVCPFCGFREMTLPDIPPQTSTH